MNRNRLSILLVLAIATSFSIPSSIAATKPKAAGRSSTAVINTVLNGKGAPSNTLGINGDFYIDTRSLLISGPKANGKWPAARSMQGANGTNGNDGRNGTDAKNVSTASNVAGPAGPQGERGEKGVEGMAGTSGSAGAAGVPGAAGAIGPAGSTGPAGSGATGAQGSPGTNGTNGTNGGAGVTGLTGSRGETGTVGPSEVTVISIPTWTLQTATEFGSANSSGFGLLKAGKSYQISIQLWGTTNSADSPYGLELLSSTGVAPTYFYTVMPYRYAMTSTTSYKYGFSVIGTITVGASDISLSIKIVDAVGDTTTKPMVMTGKALITLVGAVL